MHVLVRRVTPVLFVAVATLGGLAPAARAGATEPPAAGAEATNGDASAGAAEMGITSTEVAPAKADESAQAVPVLGSHEVWCTQSNPDRYGICAGHHTYPAIDIGMPVGTPVYATGPGVVHELRRSASDARGLYVVVHHPDGIYSRYLHLSSISVNAGDQVRTGTLLGLSGETGSAQGSPHLHYDEQRPYGTPKDLGTMVGWVGQTATTYPDAFGYASWSSVPYGSILRNDRYAPAVAPTPHQWGGPSVTTGDFNGDGRDDIAAGVPGKDTGTAVDAGAVTVVYGSARGVTTTGSQQLVAGVDGLAGNAEAGDTFGAAVAAGDFNGDRFDDLAVGVPREDTGGGADAGAIVIIPGSSAGLVAQGSHQRWAGGGLPGTADAGDQLGAALAAGDFNRDGRADLGIGVPGDDTGATDGGAVVVAYGSTSGLGDSSGIQLVSGQDGLAGVSQPGDLLGAALAAGELDGHGYDDLAMGSPGQDVGSAANAGQVIAVAGSPTGINPATSLQVRAGVRGITGRSERDDVFGAAVAIADVNGTSPADLVVGVPGEDAAAVNDGAIAVIPGTPFGLTSAGSRQYWSGSSGSAGTAGDQDLLGASLAVGDVDGDGQAEILVGVPGKDVGRTSDAGAVLVLGSVDGVLTADSPSVAGAAGTHARLGRSLAAGDIDGDGLADLVASAPTENAAGVDTSGALTVVPGIREVGLGGARSRHLSRGHGGLVGTAKEGDQFGGLLPPYLF